MLPLQLELFGPMKITRAGMPIPFRSDKERALLVFLAIEADRPHRREALTGLLYPEQAQTPAQNNLRKTLFRLRAALGENNNATSLLLVTPKTVQFNPAGAHTLDVTAFQTIFEETRTHLHRRAETCAHCATRLQNAIQIYRGEFLAGFNGSGSSAFEEWATITRERLHHVALEALEQLVAFHRARGEWERVAYFARRLLEQEIWRESAHRALMYAFAAQGQRAAALAQYNACKNILATHFEAEPERDTTVLGENIRQGTFILPEASPFHLPQALTPLIGRAPEIEIETARLLDPSQRLHTIAGPGGIGKTRLALALAEQVQHDFREGAFFVALAGVNAEHLEMDDVLATAIAGALNLAFSGSVAPAQQLLNALRQKELLLVLDNMEHLLAGATFVLEILQRAPRITILVTTREPLNVSPETILRLEGLAVPADDHEMHWRASDSVQLFIERAARAAGQFTMTPENLGVVREICQRVEGMPLAIELAAAQLRTRPLEEIAASLRNNLEILTSTQRDTPPRHRSLRAVWEGSWASLSAQEQQILTQAIIFQGGFSHHAAQEIIKAQKNYLDILVSKSLLNQSIDSRYSLHELLIQFILDNSSNHESDKENQKNDIDKKDIKIRHSAFYLNYIARHGSALVAGDAQIRTAELHRELDNIRAAWQTALDLQRFDDLAHALEGITLFFYQTGLYHQGLNLLEQALASPPPPYARKPDPAHETRARGISGTTCAVRTSRTRNSRAAQRMRARPRPHRTRALARGMGPLLDRSAGTGARTY